MNKFINEKLMPPMMKFLNTKAVTAIKNGMLYPIPFIIIGAIFLILANFPNKMLRTGFHKLVGPLFLTKPMLLHLVLWPSLQPSVLLILG